MVKETVGKLSSELRSKEKDNTHTAYDQMREQLEEYDKNIFECIARSKKDFFGNFYVVVITKKERLMSNVIRNYFTARLSCPTPEYDQAVYLYKKNDESINLIWVIPSKDTCTYLIAVHHTNQLHFEEYELYNFVYQFAHGDLFKLCKHLNGEEEATNKIA